MYALICSGSSIFSKVPPMFYIQVLLSVTMITYFRKNRSQDLISNLPQDIISHILSFLPTKDAVQTSVLSKGWIHHWTRATSLDIIDMELEDTRKSIHFSEAKRERFDKFLNKLLQSLSSPTIYSIKLHLNYAYYYGYFHDEKLIEAWIDTILRRRVQKLEIIYEFGSIRYKCLSSIFHCSSLVELDLTLSFDIRFLFSHCLPNLQFLKLRRVYFRIPSSLEPVDSFPVLKSFEIIECKRIGGKDHEKINIVINAPKLERFLLEKAPLGPLKINAPNLKSVAYIDIDGVGNNILVSNPLSVVDVTLKNSYTYGYLKTYPILFGLSNLEGLTMCDWKFADYIPKLPTFGRLICLTLHISCNLPQDVLLSLLHKSPILEKLELHSLFRYDLYVLLRDLVDALKKVCQVPQCFLSSLKFVQMHSNDKYKYTDNYIAAFLKEVKELENLISSAPTIKIYDFGDELLCTPL